MTPPFRLVRDASADNTNQVVKIGEGEVAYFILFNGGTVDAWFHLYDSLTADVIVGTTVPTASFVAPAGASATHVGLYEFEGKPIHFEKGIIYACTTSVSGGTDCIVKPVLGILEYR